MMARIVTWPTRLLLLLLAAACVPAQPPPPSGPPEVLPPLARAALEEWQAWGRLVVIGWTDDRPADTAATQARFDRLVEYWYAVPGNTGVARRLMVRRTGATWMLPEPPGGDPETETPLRPPVDLPVEDIAIYAYPAWSAAFIGFVARRAGISEYDLPSMPTHARYIDRMLRRAQESPDTAAFLPYAPEERPLRSGDLLCADRSNHPLAHWSQRLADRGRFRPMHCDVVVRLRPGVVEVVGGNVADMVVLRRFPTDAQGRVLPAPEGRPRFLLVLSPREDGA